MIEFSLLNSTRHLRERLIAEHQRAGVTFELPDSVVIEASVRLAQDVVGWRGRAATRHYID